MVEDSLIKSVQTTFSMYGLIVTRKVSAYVARQLESVNEDERETWLKSIAEHILSQNIDNINVDIEHIKAAIIECIRPEDSLQDTETILNVISAHDVPKVKYDVDRKKFVLEKVEVDLYPEAAHKCFIFSERLILLWQRILKHERYAPLKFGEKDSERLTLTPIEYLLSSTKTDNVHVMGLLTQLTEGQFYLEDTGGTVKVDLSKTIYKSSLVVEGSIIIAYGDYDDDLFRIKEIDFPPPELSEDTRAFFSDANTFGGAHPTSLKSSEKLKSREAANADARIVFLSEFWVDSPQVLDKFKTMLDGYSDFPPIAFVLCGHFLSVPPNAMNSQKMKEGFKLLADLIKQFPEIRQNSKFILIPGPYDPCASKILPRGPLPKYIVENFVKTIPGVVLATNPCRIQYCTKEIVVLREDMLTKLCRNTLQFPNTGQLCEHFAKSIICQSHLTPMSLSVIPVYWKLDHALQIYPTPDLIVVADQFEPYSTSYSKCQVINPGAFPKNNFSFKVYVPASDLIEDCEIPPDEDV